jgi:hypothetical protein
VGCRCLNRWTPDARGQEDCRSRGAENHDPGPLAAPRISHGHENQASPARTENIHERKERNSRLRFTIVFWDQMARE